MMFTTNIQDRRIMKAIRFRVIFLAFMLLLLLCAGGCGKDPAVTVSTVAEPASTSATDLSETATTVPGSTNATVETTTTIPETTTPVSETTTTISETETTTTETTTTVADTMESAPESQEFVRRRGGNGEPITMIPLSEIPYERPDFEKLFADMDALITLVADGADVNKLVNAYRDIRGRMTTVQTMTTLAYFRYCQDVTDSYYSGEMDYTSAQSMIMNQKHNDIISAMADSSLRVNLESAYFGHGYFAYNVKKQNETYLEMVDREKELLDQFNSLIAVPTVSYQGETRSLNEWLESESSDIRDGANAAFIQDYHDPIGNLFIELVKIRQQIAQSIGYNDYMSYAFKLNYRDYSTDRAEEFMKRVKAYLVPLLQTLSEQNTDLFHLGLPAFRNDPLEHLATATEEIGGIIGEAYRFMIAYELCDINTFSSKQLAAYATYLPDYESPILISYGDYLSLAHEFGHYVDLYYNYGSAGRSEINEVFSTAMEYLAIAYDPSLNQDERVDSLRTVLIYKLLNSIIETCANFDFEMQVYKIDSDKLTLEALDELYYQCRMDYGLRDRYSETIDRGLWIMDWSYFEYPGCNIAYPIANIVSLQLSRLETNDPGAGIEAFGRLLEMGKLVGIEIFTKNARLQSPFASSTIEQIAEFLKEALELP